jgi:hypothetical protein
MTAKGLDGRLFRVRSLWTLCGFAASQDIWNPPMPLIATIAPLRSCATAIVIASAAVAMVLFFSTSVTVGPHEWQAFGCAWYLRLRMSLYSVLQSRHMENSSIVVLCLSYGSPVMMEKRGPQLVQLMNGYRKRLSRGSFNSARQSSHIPISGHISPAGFSLSVRLSCMLNEVKQQFLSWSILCFDLRQGGQVGAIFWGTL